MPKFTDEEMHQKFATLAEERAAILAKATHVYGMPKQEYLDRLEYINSLPDMSIEDFNDNYQK